MVSNASEDLPEPLTPVTTVMRLIGIENEMFLRLLTRAPRTSIASWVMIGACKAAQRGIRRSRKPHILTRKPGQSEGGGIHILRHPGYEVSTTRVSGWTRDSSKRRWLLFPANLNIEPTR